MQLMDQDSSFGVVPLYELNTYSFLFFNRSIIYTIHSNGSFQVTSFHQVIVSFDGVRDIKNMDDSSGKWNYRVQE